MSCFYLGLYEFVSLFKSVDVMNSPSRLKFTAIFLFVCSLCVAVASDTMPITSKSGKVLKAYVVSVDDTSVVFHKNNKAGKRFELPFSSLSEASVEKLKKWKQDGGGLSTEFEMIFASGKSDRLSEREQYDDQTLKLRPELTVKNSHLNMPSKPCKVSVVILGKDVTDRDVLHVFINETKEVGSLEGGGEMQFKFSKINRDYDNTGYAQYGHTYYGYVAILHDGKGTIYSSISKPATLVKRGKKWLELQQGKNYDKDLELY